MFTQADYLQLVPPVAIQLIKSAQASHANLSTVKSIYSAAAPLGKEVETQLAAMFKLQSISQSKFVSIMTSDTLSGPE